MNTRLFFGSILLVALGACSETSDPISKAANGTPRYADKIVLASKIYLDGTDRRIVSAFAMADGRILAVGNHADMEPLIGPETDTFEITDGVVFPGLVDAHVHPFQGGEKTLYMCNFPFSTTPEQLAQTLATCVEKTEAPTWIVGGQWSSNFFVDNDIPSPRAFLDSVSKDHPIFLDDDSAHHGWANSKALEMAGVTVDTPNPDGGIIVRSESGEPTGVLLEKAAHLVAQHIPDYTYEQKVAAIAAAADIANGFGVTAFGEARAPETVLSAYQTADQRGDLTVRALLYQQGHGMAGERLEPVDAYIERAKQYRSPNIDAQAIKFFLDGVPTASRSALMHNPYTVDAKHPHTTHGIQMIPTKELYEAVAAFDAAGFRIKIHTAGDAAVTLALDAIAEARQRNGAGLPISLAHAGYVAEDDIPRFYPLNAVADFSPYLWYPRPIIDSVVQAVGEPRGSQYFPTRDLLAAQAPMAAGSDWPAAAADMNPWPAIEALITREHPDGSSSGTLWSDQRVSLNEAILLWTTKAADVLGFGEVTGRIAEGFSADFIVLPADPHTIPVEDISTLLPIETWFRGEQVFKRMGENKDDN
jgi:hypothetical protein